MCTLYEDHQIYVVVYLKNPFDTNNDALVVVVALGVLIALSIACVSISCPTARLSLFMFLHSVCHSHAITHLLAKSLSLHSFNWPNNIVVCVTCNHLLSCASIFSSGRSGRPHLARPLMCVTLLIHSHNSPYYSLGGSSKPSDQEINHKL